MQYNQLAVFNLALSRPTFHSGKTFNFIIIHFIKYYHFFGVVVLFAIDPSMSIFSS